jgi:hypothetical protein
VAGGVSARASAHKIGGDARRDDTQVALRRARLSFVFNRPVRRVLGVGNRRGGAIMNAVAWCGSKGTTKPALRTPVVSFIVTAHAHAAIDFCFLFSNRRPHLEMSSGSI